MKQRILELLNGMNSYLISHRIECKKELCKILTSVINKKDKIESYADKYILDYPDKITSVEWPGKCSTLPDVIWCNDNDFDFETKWLDIDWESYFEELKQSSIRSIERAIEKAEKSIVNHKERIAILSHRQFNDLEF